MQPRREVRVGLQFALGLGDFADKAHLDIRAAECVAHQVRRVAQHVIQVAQVVGQLRFNPRMQRCTCVTQASDVEVEHQRQHGRAFGKMQPLHIAVVGIGGRVGLQLAVAVAADEVVDDRGGLDQHTRAVFDHRGFAQGVNGLEFRRRQVGLGVALVAFDVVGQAQFFKRPQDTL